MRALLALTSLFALQAVSPTQSVVRDIASPNIVQPSSTPRDYLVVNGIAYFIATDILGAELWRSDGTANGTWRVKDIAAGRALPSIRDMVAVGNRLFFTAIVRGYGREVWTSDGTSAGTRLVKDIETRYNLSSNPAHLTEYKGLCWFSAQGQLWTSDGTAANTKKFVDLNGGAAANPRNFGVMGGKLYFSATKAGIGYELWSTDGTVAGTTLVADIAAGATSSAPDQLTAVGNRLFFVATTPATGRELFVSDGTANGTKLVRDIMPGTTGSGLAELTAFGSKCVFSATDASSAEPWISDGTTAGTVQLKDIASGAARSDPRGFTVANGKLYFSATSQATGREPWISDGTTAGTRILRELAVGVASSSPTNFTVALNGIVFRADSGGPKLFKSDGTAAGTVPVQASNAINPLHVTAFGKEVLFTGSDRLGWELYKTDGKTTGLLKDVAPAQGHARPSTLVQLGSKLFFYATQPTTGAEPWLSDGTNRGTQMILDVYPGGVGSRPFNQEVTLWNGEAWFSGSGRGVGVELFRSDGTAAGTKLAADVAPGGASSAPHSLTPAGSRLFFAARIASTGEELHVTDGSKLTSFDLYPGTRASAIRELTAVGTRAFFRATDGTSGHELWTSDGTKAGTKIVVDLVPGSGSSNPSGLVALGSKLIFAATTTATGAELMVSDGTKAGTKLLKDIWPGTAGSAPRGMIAVGNKVFYEARTRFEGYELHVTDGTTAGTRLIKDIAPGFASIDIKDSIGVNGRLFFFVNDRTHGYELWTSDGTANGTKLIKDLMPGNGDGVAFGTLRRLGATSLVVFAGMDGKDGLQVWSSDGTAAGTTQLGRIGDLANANSGRGSGAAYVEELTTVGSTLFYGADDGVLGHELWSYSLTGGNRAFAEPYGRACRGSNRLLPAVSARGLPRLGNTAFGVDLSNARENSAAVEYLSVLPTAIGLGGTCRLLVAPPLIPIATVATDRFGFGSAPLPIPNDAKFLGARVYVQYVIVDIGGPLFRTFALSDGLSVRIGR